MKTQLAKTLKLKSKTTLALTILGVLAVVVTNLLLKQPAKFFSRSRFN